MSTLTLATYVGAADSDADYVTACADVAGSLVTEAVGNQTIPEEIRARAILEVGADLYHRRTTRNGIATFGDGMDPAVFRVGADPLKAARPLLAPWLEPPIGG